MLSVRPAVPSAGSSNNPSHSTMNNNKADDPKAVATQLLAFTSATNTKTSPAAMRQDNNLRTFIHILDKQPLLLSNYPVVLHFHQGIY
jgi:hypothetical protein